MKSVEKLQLNSWDGIVRIWRNRHDNNFIREFYIDTQPDEEQGLPLRVDFIHEEHCYENYYRRRENSEVFSIEMVLEGSMLFEQEGRSFRVMPGEVFLVQLDRQSEFTTGPEKHCHRLACSLKGNILNPILQSTGLSEQDVIQLQDAPDIESLLRRIFQEFKEKKPRFRRSASRLAYELLLKLADSIQHKNTSRIVSRSIELMEHHLSQTLSLKKLAALVGTSPTSLHREFQQQLQTSPINHFIHLKMETAKSLLLHTNLQIQEIAERVGYDNPLYFSAEFKKRVGISPRHFRAKPTNNK